MTEKAYDALVVGGGHNGLTCACYLAAGGLKVRVLERREVLGGAAVTEEFHPGFRNSVAAYTVSLLQPKVIRDLHLEAHGLRILPRQLPNFLPLPDGDHLKIHADSSETLEAVRRFSARDARRLPDYWNRLETVAGVLRELVLRTPPNLGTGAGIGDYLRAAQTAGRLRKLDDVGRRDTLELFTRSAGEWLDDWFESDPLKAVLGFDAVVGNYASPYAANSAYVLLHHVFGELDGRRGVWGHAIGGMGAITQAMASEARARGVELSTGAAVARVETEHGRVRGVSLEDGSFIPARRVVSNLNPKLLYQRLMDPADLPPDLLERIGRYRCGSGSFRMNVALSELPDFSCLPGRTLAEHHHAGIIMAPSLAYMDRAWKDAEAHGWSRQPVVEMLIPSVVDETLAPAGKHVASLFCQQFAPRLPDGSDWSEHREAAARTVIETVTGYAPNFADSIEGMAVLSPQDLEERFGLTGGDIFHGALSPEQLYSARPVLGYGDYRGPVEGLYMCGAGTHPGGGVTGAPGHNAAREILKDGRRPRAR